MAWRTGSGPPDREDPDGEMVDRARRGDRDAFGELVRKYQDRIVNYARALVSDAADAEDIGQETFLRAYRALGRFRRQSLFKTWLYQIATNVARTALARRRARAEDGRGSFAGGGEPALVEPPSPEDVEATVVNRDRIDRALAALPEDLRQAVVLRDVEGFEYREIAGLLEIPIGTVESRIFRARERLREALAPGE